MAPARNPLYRIVLKRCREKRANAKIVATLGPASSDAETIMALHRAGADVFRINFSHGDREDHQARIRTIRAAERELRRPIGILADLQGPKIRIGAFADGPVTLDEGAVFQFDQNDAPGDTVRVSLPHPEIFAALSPGQTLLIDDGKLRLEVS